MKIEIYGKPRCPSCTRAKQLCELRGLDYEYKLLDADFTFDELLEKVPGAKTFPQIFIDEKPIGGFDKFSGLLNHGSG